MCYMGCRYENFDGECRKPIHIMCPLFYGDYGYQARSFNMRFDEEEDCYLDTKTGLKWSKENLGPMTWQDAVDKVPSGWRLPTLEELLAILDHNRLGFTTELPGILPSDYWSSTTYASGKCSEWYVHFSYGKSSAYYVRYVKES